MSSILSSRLLAGVLARLYTTFFKMLHMQNMQNMYNVSNIKNMTNMLYIQNMQNMYNTTVNMSKIQNMLNMSNIQNSADLVHKIVYLALCPLFLELGVVKLGSLSSSVSSARVALGVVLGPATVAGEGTAGAAGAEVAERPQRRFFAGSRRWARSASLS
jgi:hypothetical protein